ncbi:MAG: NUDIX domain-containing protein [Nanoarchaeota archaeon]
MEEQIYEVDWEDNVIGIRNKSELKQRIFTFRASLIIPRTDDNKFIISRRAKDKFPFPDVWTCTAGGKVQANESYEEAAIRELEEETSIKTELEFITTSKYDGDKEKGIYKMFTTKNAIDINKLIPDTTEIQYFREFTLEEIENMIKEKSEEFAPTFIIHFKEFCKKIKINEDFSEKVAKKLWNNKDDEVWNEI